MTANKIVDLAILIYEPRRSFAGAFHTIGRCSEDGRIYVAIISITDCGGRQT